MFSLLSILSTHSFTMLYTIVLFTLWNSVHASDPLAQDVFVSGDSAGWTVSNQNGQPVNFIAQADASGLSATDKTSLPWYFVASPKFSGNFMNAYNGKLEFSLIHTEILDSNARAVSAPNILLKAQCGHSLMWSGAMAAGHNSVILNEYAGWKDSRTGRPPMAVDMLGVLSHLQTIMIRGGFFSGGETTTIQDVSLLAGKPWYPCCILGNIDVCAKQPSGYGQPPALVHYCEGSFRRPVKVTRVEPRFARRSGGATITIIGENFGLSGSEPIVRINNRPCQKTYYPPSTYLNNLNIRGVPTAVNAMSNNVDSSGIATFDSVGFLATGPTAGNPAGNALANAFDAATDSFKSTYPEHCWNGMKDDGTDTGFNYGTATAAKYINQGETGIDTGGPCFPPHCSSCPDNGKSWCVGNQIVAVSSGSCKGRALAPDDAEFACARFFPYMHYPRLCPDDAESPLRSLVVTSPPVPGLVSSPVLRTWPINVTEQSQTLDFLDVKSTILVNPIGLTDSMLTVSNATLLTCADLNLPTRNCALYGVTEFLIENYIKVVDMNVSTAPSSMVVEVMKVVAVSGNNLTVERGQGGTSRAYFNRTSWMKTAVFLCGRDSNCLVAVKDLSVGRRIKVDNEIMRVKNYAAISSVTASSTANCGSFSATAVSLTVTCMAPCSFVTPLRGYVNINASGSISAITITDPGSGYDPNNLPTVANIGTCSLTVWWSSVVVIRGVAGTAAVRHGGRTLAVERLNCLDDDETGDNCGGSCKPCPETVKGPQEHTRVVCITPEAPFDEPMRNLEVTVEAASGPTDTPYQVRMDPKLQKWQDQSTHAVSCVTAASRGFSFGAHDFAWGVHIRTVAGSADVTAMTVDENNGEVYVLGTMQGTIYLEGKHIMTRQQMGSLSVSPAVAGSPLTATCTGALNQPISIAGTGNDDCGRSSFIAQFSRDGRPIWLNLLETKLTTSAASATAQAVITDAAFDPAKSELYVVGYYSDGMTKTTHSLVTSTVLTLYDVDPKTRMASTAAPSSTVAAQAPSGISRYYQEGFMVKYSRAGAVQWAKAVGYARALPSNMTGLATTQMRVAVYKASTSNILNTQSNGLGAPPSRPTQTSRKDIEYDNGFALGAVQGGTGTETSITLKAASSATDRWYVGLKVRILEGAGTGQERTIYEYNGTTKVARVTAPWDPLDVPAAGSKYTILGGRPTSWLSGMHWSNGGVYVSGRLETVCGPGCSTATDRGATSVVIGEMPVDYRDANAQTTAKYVQVLVGQDDHQNFLAQFDLTGKVFWSRMVGNNGAAGTVTLVYSPKEFTVGPDASAADGFYAGCSITIIDGAGSGQTRVIAGYTGASRNVTVSVAFSPTLTTASRYIIGNKGTTGTAAAAGSTTSLTLIATPTKNGMDGVYNGSTVVITGGTGEGQVARIQSYNGNTRVATISTLATAPDTTSTYHIMDAASVVDLAAMQDLVFLTGYFTNPGLRLQNCSFDAATVLEGPPANTPPVTVFECASIGLSPVSANDATKTEFVVSGSTSTDVAVGVVSGATTMALYTAAYNGSGSLVWLRYAAEGAVRPRAMASLAPSLGADALSGDLGSSPNVALPGRNQVPYRSAAKDVGSEKGLSAVVAGPWIVVVGEVYDHTNAADFGRTVYPLSCSSGKRVGAKNVSTLRLLDTPCAGKVVAQATASDWWPTSGRSTAVPDVILVVYHAVTGDIHHIRRTGQKNAAEMATSVAVHPSSGAVFVSGEYYLQSAAGWQGSSTAAGEDVFGLGDADRLNSLGCPRSRLPGQAADPYCRFYSHGASTHRPTGFVAKFNFNGDETNRGNLNRRQDPSVTGYLEAASTWEACSVTLGPAAGAADAQGTTHVLTGSAACSTHVSGCSCLSMQFKSRTFAAGAADADSSASPYGPGPLSKFSGMRIRITDGRSMGYEGVISAYSVANRVYNVVPSLPATGVDETSTFQLYPFSQFTPRNHLNSCDKLVDQGCSAYGVEWAKTVGTAVGSSASALFPQSSPRALVTVDSDVYVAGWLAGFVGWPAFGVEGVDEAPGSATLFRSNAAVQAPNGAAGASFLASVANNTDFFLAAATTNDLSAQVDYYRGLYISILEGPGAGESQLITSYGTYGGYSVHVEPGFSTTPTTASRYVITNLATGGRVGGATNSSMFTLAVDAASIAVGPNYFIGSMVTFVAGPCAGDTRTIVGYESTSRFVQLNAPLTTTPTTASQYILYYVAGLLSQTDAYLLKLQD